MDPIALQNGQQWGLRFTTTEQSQNYMKVLSEQSIDGGETWQAIRWQHLHRVLE
ncbi:MAG: hypothetical protein P8J61_01290 [Gammaproteobacteria bacterium]|jgi:hypothetical protein|nr:hypothetical protein [Gammaproteobacteria bacterium]